MPPPDAKVARSVRGPLRPSLGARTAKVARQLGEGVRLPSKAYAEQELAFRKRRSRRLKPRKARKAQGQRGTPVSANAAENCAQLTALENGQRMSRLNENGERVSVTTKMARRHRTHPPVVERLTAERRQTLGAFGGAAALHDLPDRPLATHFLRVGDQRAVDRPGPGRAAPCRPSPAWRRCPACWS